MPQIRRLCTALTIGSKTRRKPPPATCSFQKNLFHGGQASNATNRIHSPWPCNTGSALVCRQLPHSNFTTWPAAQSGFHHRANTFTATLRYFGGGPRPKVKGKFRRKKSRNKKNNETSPESTKVKQKGKKKSKPTLRFNPDECKSPQGRPVMTEQRFLSSDVLQNQLKLSIIRSIANPKSILHNAKQKMGFDLSIRHELYGDSFVVTMTASFPEGDLELYGCSKHPHFSQRTIISPPNEQEDDYNDADSALKSTTTTTELTCLGLASTKKAAESLAAADVLAVLFDLGIDGNNPPAIKQLRRERISDAEEHRKQLAKEQAEAIYKQDLARASMLLELLNASQPAFEVTKGNAQRVNGNLQWVATASAFLRGRSIIATGDPASKKAEAEGKALIALATSQEVQDIIGSKAMETIARLIENSPGQRIASLMIPPIADDLLGDLAQCVGTASDHELRIQRHLLAKDEYEYSLKERHGSVEGGQHRQAQYNNKTTTRSPTVLREINSVLKTEEAKRVRKAMDHPDSKEAANEAIRDALPIKRLREELVEALRTQQVVVVSGGTGSGKSTQCPQYILEDAIANDKGAETQIIVTQPRRIAAISVAERVADERSERTGNSIGYTVRFQKKPPRDYGGSIEFVTTGVLLRRLINDPMLAGISHVLIDEVHERDINTDFLLVLLRDLLKQRPDLRVVLMSATLDAESFSEYFSSGTKESSQKVPLLSVPAQPRHPVEVFYLEDILNSSAKVVPSGAKRLAAALLQHNDAQLKTDLEEALEEERAAADLQERSRAEDEGEMLKDESDSDDADVGIDAAFVANTPARRVETLKKAVSLRQSVGALSPTLQRDDKFDPRGAVVELATKVALHLSEEELQAGRSGSILCFLPGWDEIKLATEECMKSGKKLREQLTVLPLHSTIPQDEQQKVFLPANGKIKLILATNIAESSVTIDDVLAVVDSGLVREMIFDAESAMSAMETNKISKASATQRLGRAGRVAPGKCYRLYSRGDFASFFERPTPEIQRTALEATCLQTCSMATKKVGVFLSEALDPPADDSVAMAMERLTRLGAIEVDEDDSERLTPLGRFLSRLPLDPATGRMLIMGVVMKCLDPLLTSAACFSSRNVFYNPPGKRDEAQQIRRSFSETSDIAAMVNAYQEFWTIVEDEGWPEARNWAFDNYVSIAALTSMKAVRSQLLEELHRADMIPHSDLEGRRKDKSLRWDAEVNKNADNERLYTALWATAFPENLASRRPLGSFGTLRTRLDEHAGLHPSSVTFHRRPPRNWKQLPSWYLYREMVLSSQIFLRDATAMEPEQIILFGGYNVEEVESAPGASSSSVQGVLDDWIVVESRSKETVDLLIRARRDIEMVLQQKVMNPRAQIAAESQDILDVVCDVLDPFPDKDEEYE